MYKTEAVCQAGLDRIGCMLDQHSNEHCYMLNQHGTNMLVLRSTDEQNHIWPT